MKLMWQNLKYIFKSVSWNIDEFQKHSFLLTWLPSGAKNHSGAVFQNANNQSDPCWGISQTQK